MATESPETNTNSPAHCGSKPKKVAFGIAPLGVVAIGIVPMGVVCIGVVPMGVVGIGLVSMGAVTASVVGMGLLSVGLNTMAVWTAGPLSMGFVNLTGTKQQIPHIHHSHPHALKKNSHLESQLMYTDEKMARLAAQRMGCNDVLKVGGYWKPCYQADHTEVD
ncbi:hypothetical protein [Synechococcus sp. UW179A]|uniref:hypothetical protein n=1 Tax=Synechococcus sp. UW179A TaxID=2575510 RepID=UPI000E0FB63A|nr:hypothetical protein [Synechococcus sp. UW179A]